MSDFVTADTHFGHAAMVPRRGFDSIGSMDAALVYKWNSVVKRSDTVYLLGDVSFAKETAPILARLHGHIVLVYGNHDGKKIRALPRWSAVHPYLEYRRNHHRSVLCHYALEVWRDSHHGSTHMHGHSHGSLPPRGRRMDVGVDCHGLTPISMDLAIAQLRARDVAMPDYHAPRGAP